MRASRAGAPLDQLGELPGPLHTLAGGAGAALAGDGHDLDPECVESGVDCGLAVAAIGGHGPGHPEKQAAMRTSAGTSIGASGGLPMMTVWSTTMPSALSTTCAL